MLVAGRRGGMAERVARGQVKSTSWPSELLGAKYWSRRACGCVLELRRGERSRRERKGHGGPTSGVTNVVGLSVCHEAEE